MLSASLNKTFPSFLLTKCYRLPMSFGRSLWYREVAKLSWIRLNILRDPRETITTSLLLWGLWIRPLTVFISCYTILNIFNNYTYTNICFVTHCNTNIDTTGYTVWTIFHLVIKLKEPLTGTSGAVALASANGLAGTGFASWYRLQPRPGF